MVRTLSSPLFLHARIDLECIPFVPQRLLFWRLSSILILAPHLLFKVQYIHSRILVLVIEGAPTPI